MYWEERACLGGGLQVRIGCGGLGVEEGQGAGQWVKQHKRAEDGALQQPYMYGLLWQCPVQHHHQSVGVSAGDNLVTKTPNCCCCHPDRDEGTGAQQPHEVPDQQHSAPALEGGGEQRQHPICGIDGGGHAMGLQVPGDTWREACLKRVQEPRQSHQTGIEELPPAEVLHEGQEHPERHFLVLIEVHDDGRGDEVHPLAVPDLWPEAGVGGQQPVQLQLANA
mmetsp:Transcript_11453/g.20652  ORF Transcript_11453/g.20652 Transcript_11453/m.20652 type:complete len:222 (+) Transcript_11453:2761-3426(+)